MPAAVTSTLFINMYNGIQRVSSASLSLPLPLTTCRRRRRRRRRRRCRSIATRRSPSESHARAGRRDYIVAVIAYRRIPRVIPFRTPDTAIRGRTAYRALRYVTLRITRESSRVL